MAENLRRELVDKNEARNTALDPNGILDSYKGVAANALPQEVHVYHTLYPLGVKAERISRVFGLPTSVYKSVRRLDGKCYCLRRIENYRIGNEQSISCIEAWTKIRHAGIVSVREGFTTKAFGDLCNKSLTLALVLVYDFHPLSETLHSKYFAKSESINYHILKSDLLWSYICQLACAISTVHSAQLAVRVVEASKILITGENR